MYNVIIESEVRNQLIELRTYLVQLQGDKKGNVTFEKIISAIDNLQFHEIGYNIRDTYFVDCSEDWFVLYSNKNYFVFSRTKDTVKVLKMYNEKQDFIYDLFGVEMRSKESKVFWNE